MPYFLVSFTSSSAALIVICSPDAASSSYVDDEVRRFAKISPGNERKIVPILYRGVPNNEVKPSHEHESAFPPALCEALGMPVGINYLGFDLAKHKLNRGAYFNSWYALLANVCGVSRAEIEERDRLRQSRQRRFQAAVIGVVCISTEALAYRAVYRGGGVHVGGVYRGGVGRVGVYHGAYARRGVGLYNAAGCGYAPYPRCY